MDTVATMARENSGTAPKLRTYAGIRGVTLSREVFANGGATLDLSSDTLALADKTTGYFVGGATAPLTYKLADVDTRHFQHALKTVYGAMNGTGYFGAWADGGIVWMEGSDWFATLAEAKQAGKTRGQFAIWDIANAADIFI